MLRPKHLSLRRAVIDTCLAMNALGINQGTSGNVSVRTRDGGPPAIAARDLRQPPQNRRDRRR